MKKNDLLSHKFNKLIKEEQDILTVLAILFVPLGQVKFKEILKKLKNIEPSAAKCLEGNEIRDQFKQSGFIELSRDGWRCSKLLRERLMRQAVIENSLLINELDVYFKGYSEYVSAHLKLVYRIRQARMALHQFDTEIFIIIFNMILVDFNSQINSVIEILFFEDFDEEWFDTRVSEIKIYVLGLYIKDRIFRLTSESDRLFYFKKSLDKAEEEGMYDSGFYQKGLEIYLEYNLIRGEFLDNNVFPSQEINGVSELYLSASNCFILGDNDKAISLYQDAIEMIQKTSRKRKVILSGIHGYFFNLALFKTLDSKNLERLKSQISSVLKTENENSELFYYSLESLKRGVTHYQFSNEDFGDKIEYKRFFMNSNPNSEYLILFYVLILYWLRSENIDIELLNLLEIYCVKAEKNQVKWYAALGCTLLECLEYKSIEAKKIAEKYEGNSCLHLLNLLPYVEPWEKALQALTNLNTPNKDSVNQSQSRLIWLLSMNAQGIGKLEPREQKLNKSGKWSKGRSVALKRLYNDADSIGFLTAQDRKICGMIEVENDYYFSYGRGDYVLESEALLEAIEHPHVYWSTATHYTHPITIKKAEPQLLVTNKGENLLISLHPAGIEGEIVFLVKRMADDELLVYDISEQHLQVAAILGNDGLVVPQTAKQQVIDSIASIASTLTVQSDLEGMVVQNIESVEADSRLHLHLIPLGEGLQIDTFVQPFNNEGPIYKPAAGGLNVLAEIDGKQVQTVRNFELEGHYLEKIYTECMGLYHSKEHKWELEDPEIALDNLIKLQELGEFVVLEWPKGQKIRVSRELKLIDAHFSVRKEKDWFSIEGEVQVSETEVYDMQRLINLLNASSGRFLRLEDGQFIALTSELRQRLDDVMGLGEQKGNGVKFHSLAAPALNEALVGMDIQASKQWHDQLEKLDTMAELTPVIPSTLQGELRDYQLEGYEWMSRLAHWGAGACLADDMGLGKTIQSLSLVLSRATEGATLILAPTSVCMNWLDEAQKFTPTLNAMPFGSGDREKIINEAGAFDVIVCSYGLLQSESELLLAKQWHTIIADEAQALKNGTTKRSKAAMALQSDFKMITTGTPIENHLGELWNLFNFINPGLLGSLQKFNQKYAQAIENDKDYDTQRRLKKLLRPFILRRLKTDVLKELPSRTEITLHVELSKEERVFYEALRRNAMDSMRKSQDEGERGGAQHLKVLAEIMKLRRACCHPKLVIADSPLGSSKLQAFEELVDELLSNRHKALVFSQFVTHLTIIRELLDKKGIHYQYLDGSTSVAKRKKAVNNFQAGEGDIFLISLKAGGSGLNLTAADYVIHMDPWWNPAVEDQASDRAHRMGQKRPVTIYRLVAKNTIEDKIVDLHAHKRDLASSLLEGGDVSGKMSVNDMMSLIREVGE